MGHVGMPTIELKVISAPAADRGVSEASPQTAQGAGPLFRGNGDVDYLCGSCGFVVASGMSPEQRVPFGSSTCPACGATNEFPAELGA